MRHLSGRPWDFRALSSLDCQAFANSDFCSHAPLASVVSLGSGFHLFSRVPWAAISFPLHSLLQGSPTPFAPAVNPHSLTAEPTVWCVIVPLEQDRAREGGSGAESKVTSYLSCFLCLPRWSSSRLWNQEPQRERWRQVVFRSLLQIPPHSLNL